MSESARMLLWTRFCKNNSPIITILRYMPKKPGKAAPKVITETYWYYYYYPPPNLVSLFHLMETICSVKHSSSTEKCSTTCSLSLSNFITPKILRGNLKQTFHTAQRVDKKAQLSLTNPRDAKACQKLLQFDVLTTSSLTILACLHSFSCCCVQNLWNPAKFTEN